MTIYQKQSLSKDDTFTGYFFNESYLGSEDFFQGLPKTGCNLEG